MGTKNKSEVVAKRLPVEKIIKLIKLKIDIGAAIEDMVNKILKDKKCPCCGRDL
jgi:hypothetical protein